MLNFLNFLKKSEPERSRIEVAAGHRVPGAPMTDSSIVAPQSPPLPSTEPFEARRKKELVTQLASLDQQLARLNFQLRPFIASVPNVWARLCFFGPASLSEQEAQLLQLNEAVNALARERDRALSEYAAVA